MNKKNYISNLIYLLVLVSSIINADPKLLDKIEVVVNEDVITKTMLDNRIIDFKKQIDPRQLERIKPDDLKKQVLERMIRDNIQMQKAEQMGIKIDDLLLNSMLEQLAKKNKMTLQKFRHTVEKQGINFSRFREQTRTDLTIKRLQQRLVASKITVSEQEVDQYIKQNESDTSASLKFHLQHILIALPETSTPDDIAKAKQKADDVYQKVQQGEPFEDLAIKYSNGRNALKGGDLGNRGANELPQIFVDAASKLQPKQTASPIKSVTGFHIIKLINSSKDTKIVTQTHVRHILIKNSDAITDKKARKTLLKLKQQIDNGEKFEDLASKYSQDLNSKITGGDLGWTSPGELESRFEQVANSLSLNQLSEPFKTKFGWHIIEVLEHRKHDISITNKRLHAKNAIHNRKTEQELRLWLRQIRDEAYVNIISEQS